MREELRAAPAKQAGTCVAGVAWCGMWRVEGTSPYVGIRIGGIGWRTMDDRGLAKEQQKTVGRQAE